MNSKLVIVTVLALVVWVIVVAGTSDKEHKKKWAEKDGKENKTKHHSSKGGRREHHDQNFPLKTCLGEEALAVAMDMANNMTGPVIAFRDKISAAFKQCAEDIIKDLNSSMSHSHDHKGGPHGDGHGQKIATYMCVTACALKKTGMISADGTQFNRSAIYEIVQLGMIRQVQEKYMEEVDNCLTTQKISLSSITLGDRCEELAPYMKCIDVAANTTCPATVDSTPMTPVNDDDDDENNYYDSQSTTDGIAP